MARNTALITDAAQSVASNTLDDYAGGIAAHIGGDWGGHSQAKVWHNAYVAGGSTATPYTFRMRLTNGNTETPCLVPALFYGPFTPSILPLIALQPQSQTVTTGSTYRLSVYAASQTHLFYQWKLNGADIPSANASSLLITYARAPSSGVLSYTVAVSNPYGTVMSEAAIVTVT